MTEQEWMEKIRESAEKIDVPESIFPDRVRGRLEKQKNNRARKQATMAAAILIVCGTGVFLGYQGMNGSVDRTGAGEDMIQMAEEELSQDTGGTGVTQEIAAEAEPIERRDAGTMYIVAENYGEVYDVLEEYASSRIYDLDRGVYSATSGAAMEDSIITDSVVMNETEQKLESASAMMESAAADGDMSYTKTNVQTEGVDESDIIQTDGSYIYVVSNSAVQIVDIRGDSMHRVGEVPISMNSASDRIMELYVDGDHLNLIVEREKTTLSQSMAKETEDDEVAVADVYYMDTDRTTELLTYDISNRANPQLSGTMEQDGYYKTSRKIGSIIYLFTVQMMEMPHLTRGTAILEDQVDGWVPLVGGNALAADCIYLPAEASNGNGLIISSVDINQPNKVVDNTMILNNYVEIYVSTEAIYLYGSKYTDSGIHTEIAKFGMTDGIINAVGATSAAGEVYDIFAINDNQGKLRLLTTDWSHGENENCLYLFDENLNLTGSLTGIAKGESIYAARYLGNMAYFVTYRNTDPLFAVDLSDETEPKILSELKITGFSEYLHFWGADKLVGIGYETDPDSGRREGMKLTMFDLSEPAELKTLGTCVIGNIDYSPALYNYKCVLADAGENLLGFAAETYGRGREASYLLFSWEEGRFRELLIESLASDSMTEGYRGLYAADTFYLVNEDQITSYDRIQGYQKKGELDF